MPEPVKHRVVLTGATGGLGRAILTELAARQDCEVLALVRDSSRLVQSFSNTLIERVDFADLSRLERLLQTFRPTAFIHGAATGMQKDSPLSPAELRECNVTMSVRLCELVAGISGCRFVFIGSGLAYRDQGRPLCEDDPLLMAGKYTYAASKAEADWCVREVAAKKAVPLVVIRPFSFSGVGDRGTRLFPSLLQKASEGGRFEVRSGENVRSYCAVRDIARGVLQATIFWQMTPTEAAIFNLGSDRTESLQILIKAVAEELQLNVKLDVVSHAAKPQFLVANVSRARAKLNWQPQINFAYALWELAQELFPNLKLNKPRQAL